MNSTLLAIISCERFAERITTLANTWIPALPDTVDVRVFTGPMLEVEDDYRHLPLKVKAMFEWAVRQGYDQIVKCDDDVYMIPHRFVIDTRVAYQGRVRQPSREQGGPELYGPRESSYCSGFTYRLNSRAAKIIADSCYNGDWAEDRWVGNTLAQNNIFPSHDPSFQLWPAGLGGLRHFCTIPNPNCAACQRVYEKASVLCPHERLDAIPILHRWYTDTGFIPTHFSRED